MKIASLAVLLVAGVSLGAQAPSRPVEIDRVRYDRDVMGLPDKDALVIEFGRALFRQHKIDAGLYGRIIEHFGQQGLVDLTLTLGDYVMTAFLLNAVDQQLPPGRTANLPARSTLAGARRAEEPR